MPANGDFGAEINGHTGFPNIREIRLNARQSGTRRKVIYLSSVSLSHRKNPGMSMSELVHIDRSQRLAATLARRPIDLVIKPHPMTFPTPGRHPLEARGEVRYEPFESIMSKADVFVCDAIVKTAFWEAMCSDRLVVFIDLDSIGRNTALEPIFRRRCRVVAAHYDERNRPQVDAAELEAAVADGADREDSSAYRQLFLVE